MKINIITISYNLPESSKKLFETAMLDSDKHDISFQLFLHSRHQSTVDMCDYLHYNFHCTYYPYGTNRGLSLSWNDGILYAYDELKSDVIIIANDDVAFEAGDIDKIAQKAVSSRDNYMVSVAGYNAAHGKVIPSNGYSCFALNPIGIEKIGMFDENLFPIYCLSPDTPILTADLKWIPIGDAHAGLRIIGVDEENIEGKHRRYRPSMVTSVGRRKGEAIRIIFEDGREVTCSKNHRWLGRSPRRVEPQHWIFAGDMREGFRIVSPLRTWETETSYESGWLAGMYDGEGSLHVSRKDTGTRAITLVQKDGPVLDKARDILLRLGMPIKEYSKASGDVRSIDINTRKYVFEILGRIRPVRLLNDRIWDGATIMSKNVDQFAVIKRIEELGEIDLVDISTTTKTFIANGLISHNCEDIDHHRRAHLLGLVEANCSDTKIYHTGSSAVKKDPMLGRQNMVTQSKNRQYLLAKWGVEGLDGGYKNPFNNKKFSSYISPEDRHAPYPGYNREDKFIVRF